MKKSEVKMCEESQRRKVLKSIVAGGGFAGTAAVATWTKPIVDTVVLPVHAQLSVLSRYSFVGSGPPLTSIITGDSTQLYTRAEKNGWLDMLIPSAHADDSLELWQYLLIEVSPGNFKLKVLAEGVSDTCTIAFLFIFNGVALGTGPIPSVVRFCDDEGTIRGPEGPTARLLSYGPETADIKINGFPQRLMRDPNPTDLRLKPCPCGPIVQDEIADDL